jgi:hypothetical protein
MSERNLRMAPAALEHKPYDDGADCGKGQEPDGDQRNVENCRR